MSALTKPQKVRLAKPANKHQDDWDDYYEPVAFSKAQQNLVPFSLCLVGMQNPNGGNKHPILYSVCR